MASTLVVLGEAPGAFEEVVLSVGGRRRGGRGPSAIFIGGGPDPTGAAAGPAMNGSRQAAGLAVNAVTAESEGRSPRSGIPGLAGSFDGSSTTAESR